MPFTPLLLVIVAFAVVGHAAEGSLATDHPNDVITYLWWGLGLFGSFAATVSSCVAIWMLNKVLDHDKQITEIRIKCGFMHNEESHDGGRRNYDPGKRP